MKKRTKWIVFALFMGIASLRADMELNPFILFADAFNPHLNMALAVGGATTSADALAIGGHDPTDNFTVQSIETGFSLLMGETMEGVVNWNFRYDRETEWEHELEEGFLKFEALSGGLEFRGGRVLNRFGDRNAKHLHGWNTIDQHLVNGRFLGDDGLVTDGADLTWYTPGRLNAALSFSFGQAPAHAHEEEAHDEGPDSDEIAFDDGFATANLLVQANRDDFNQFRFSASLASGDNGLGDDTTIGGCGVEYVWREHGLEAGGRQVRWMTEAMLRDFGADDPAVEGDEFGFYTDLSTSLVNHMDVGLRIGYVEGVEAFGLEERTRVSPYLTMPVPLPGVQSLQGRLQANFDELAQSGSEQGIWLQVAYALGKGGH